MIKPLRTLLQGIFTFFNTSKNLLLVSSILLAFATATWVSSSNEKLKTSVAPRKIVSLQLATDIHTSNSIAQSWSEAKVTNVALTSLRQDFAFILTYVVAFMFCIMAFNKTSDIDRWTILFSSITIIAGLADTVENISCMLFILRKIHTNVLIFIPAFIKWGAIIIVTAYIGLYSIFLILRRMFVNFTEHRWGEWFRSIDFKRVGFLLKSIKVYLPGIITVLISYFLFINLTVGQDVVIQITEYGGPFIWSLICIPLWSVFCWYSSRLVGYERLLQPGSEIPPSFHKHIPRLIAYNALVSIQAAMLSIPTIGNLTEGGVWAFIIVHNLLYFFWDKILTGKPAPTGYRAVSTVIVIAYIVTIIYLVSIGHHKHQKLLPAGAFFLFLFQMWLVRRFVERRKNIEPNPGVVAEASYIGFLRKNEWVRVPQSVREKEYWLFGRMFVIGCAGIILFAAANISPYLADHMGPLPVTLLAFGVLVILFNVGTIFSVHKGVNVFVIIIVWAFIMGKFYDPYTVRLVEPKDTSRIVRPTLDVYFKDWVNKRECMIRNSKTFPVYLVIADGGASRSGYWVASVLSQLEHESDSLHDGNTFSDHLLVLAGASGGSVGNATFYALLKNDPEHKTNYLESSREFLRQDFLTPVISHWTGADLLNHVGPFHFDDRSSALEKAMEYHGKSVLKDAFAKPFSDVMDGSGCLPILFINTTNVQEGIPAVISTIDISTFSKRVDVLDSVATVRSPQVSDIRYSTAVVMGARFPYVSPAGNLGNISFVDGGYFDNTGAGILHEMMQELKREIDNNATGIDTALLHKLKFQLIYLRNSSLRPKELKPLQPLINDLAAPIVTVLGTYGSQTDVNNLRLKTFMRGFSNVESIDINLYGQPDEEEFPMNWVISKYNLTRMDSNLRHRMKYVELLPIDRTGAVKECDCIRK